MKKLSRGILVTIEGIDCCGKSTFVTQLKSLIKNLPVVFTQEPGGTPFGCNLRTLVQQQQTPLDAKTEFLLFAADRAQHFHEIVRPAIAQKKLVISDRMADSSLVYQSYVRGLDSALITTVNEWIMAPLAPDLIFFIDITVDQAIKRINQRPKRASLLTREQRSFITDDPTIKNIQKAHAGYQQLFKEKTNVIKLNGQHAPSELANEGVKQLYTWLEQHNIYE
jgi:dTMP kinase